MHKFTFTYYGWIPSYRDFDQDDYECSAKTMQDAWVDFNKHVKFVKSAALTHIDGNPVKKDNLPKPTQEAVIVEAKVDPNVAKLSAKLRKAYDAGEDDLPRGSNKDCVKAKWPGFHGGEDTYSQVLSLRPGTGPVQQALLFISDMTGKWKKTGRKGIFNVTPKGLVFLKNAN